MKPLLPILALTALLAASCSETLQRRYDKRHGTTTAGSRYDSDRYDNETTYRDSYNRDYSKVTDADVRNADNSDDYNRKLVAQYEDMDRLADQVLFELDILDRRYNLLLEEYRNAKTKNRESISNELDRINDDQKMLYRTYTRIYREGKVNWSPVRTEVENTLLSFRRLREK